MCKNWKTFGFWLTLNYALLECWRTEIYMHKVIYLFLICRILRNSWSFCDIVNKVIGSLFKRRNWGFSSDTHFTKALHCHLSIQSSHNMWKAELIMSRKLNLFEAFLLAVKTVITIDVWTNISCYFFVCFIDCLPWHVHDFGVSRG